MFVSAAGRAGLAGKRGALPSGSDAFPFDGFPHCQNVRGVRNCIFLRKLSVALAFTQRVLQGRQSERGASWCDSSSLLPLTLQSSSFTAACLAL